MIDDGCFENVDVIFGMYFWVIELFGIIFCCFGVVMVVVDWFMIKIFGKGGYGVYLYDIKDVVLIGL